MAKLINHLVQPVAGRKRVCFWCPGCEELHPLVVEGCPEYKGPVWGWNRSYDAPTFTPSYLLSRPGFCCHSFITNGQIRFLDDCTHTLRGKTVELPDVHAELGIKPGDTL